MGGVPCAVEPVEQGAVVDARQRTAVLRGLAVLGGEDDRGAAEQVAVREQVDHRPELVIDEPQRAAHERPRQPPVGAVATRPPAGGWQLLGGRDGLEVHPEDARDPHVVTPGVIQAADLVEDRLGLEVVVALSQGVDLRPVVTSAVGDAVDLGGEEVVDTVPGGTVEDLVGRVLVGPGGPHSVPVSDLEDGVDPQVGVRHDAPTGARVDRQQRLVDEPLGPRRQPQDASGETGQALPGVEAAAVLVDGLVEGHVGAAGRVVADPPRGSYGVRRTRIDQRVVVGDVVVDAGRARVPARDLTDQSRERVGGERRAGVGVLRAAVHQPGHRRAGVVGDVPPQVGLVHAVDREQQHVAGVVVPGIAGRGGGQRARGEGSAGEDRGARAQQLGGSGHGSSSALVEVEHVQRPGEVYRCGGNGGWPEGVVSVPVGCPAHGGGRVAP